MFIFSGFCLFAGLLFGGGLVDSRVFLKQNSKVKQPELNNGKRINRFAFIICHTNIFLNTEGKQYGGV